MRKEQHLLDDPIHRFRIYKGKILIGAGLRGKFHYYQDYEGFKTTTIDGWEDIIDFDASSKDPKEYFVCTSNGFKFVTIHATPRGDLTIKVKEDESYKECSYLLGKDIKAAVEIS